MPVTRLFVEEVILECRQKHITRVDILGFEFEMGLFPNVLDEARAKGIDIAPKYIPANVFDKRAVEKNQVVFHDVAAIEVKPHVKKNSVAVELTDFSVFYSQDSIAAAEAAIKDKAQQDRGRKRPDRQSQQGRARASSPARCSRKNWTDWIDYWAVDFDFESKREIVRVPKELNPDEQARRCPAWRASGAGESADVGRGLDRRLHLRERVAELPHEEGPLAGTEERVPRVRTGAAKDRGQGGRHFRQRHDDHRRRERGEERKEEVRARPFC